MVNAEKFVRWLKYVHDSMTLELRFEYGESVDFITDKWDFNKNITMRYISDGQEVLKEITKEQIENSVIEENMIFFPQGKECLTIACVLFLYEIKPMKIGYEMI